MRTASAERTRRGKRVAPPVASPPLPLDIVTCPSKQEAGRRERGPSWNEAWTYSLDFLQRSTLFLDVLRERANNMLEHEQAGLPPLLKFDYETLLDARTFPQPANYALLRITGSGGDDVERCIDESKRAVIVFDPRAGHGPGIGGFKRDSEVGMALHERHEVYFVVFFPEPCPGQKLEHVHHALRRFVAEVSRRHGGRAPVLYGNCQAGWAVTLLSADCVGFAGPAVLNGSPLSYWAGASDINPMRLAGGLLGGTWLTHFLADIGNGRLDGAWLVQNFENLNPGHAVWGKNYELFANVDEERERFLDFERWWSGYFFLSREEILAIVENLFIGNRLEQGVMRICEHCYADLKRIRNPLVVFASSGDNITPPHQALNWIPTVYPTTEALKAAGQRIVYLLNTHVGHLGLFVSASVARLEHRAILENLEELERLAPGLYEMKILNPTNDPDCRKPQYQVVFEPRQVEAIRYDYPREDFERVRRLSEWNESLYAAFMSPWIRALANPISALGARWSHPMRMSRYLFSEKINPWMAAVQWSAPWARASRAPVDDDNVFRAVELDLSRQIASRLDEYRNLRDAWQEFLFRVAYD
jgi:hypothetical protein